MSGRSAEHTLLAGLEHVFGSHRFPIVALSLLLSASAAMAAVLLVPDDAGEVGRIARELKVWCFGYDPATGRFETVYLVMLLADPLLLAAVVLAVWQRPLRALFEGGLGIALRRAGPLALLASATVVAGLAILGLYGRTDAATVPADAPVPFPAEALRIAQTPPAFTLTDQDGRAVSLADYSGRVVVLTAVYATCGYTCPMLLGQARRAAATLTDAERRDVVFLGVTLDPAHDTPEKMAAMARAQGVAAPLFHLLSGPPATVEGVLDRLDVVRSRDPATGAIEHTNLFLLVDRQGRVAYRLSLGQTQEAWLATALRLLVAEPVPAG